MTFVFGYFKDGTRDLLMYVKDENFDVQAWTESRKDAFKILGIVRTEFIVIKC